MSHLDLHKALEAQNQDFREIGFAILYSEPPLLVRNSRLGSASAAGI
jgi:hypothetical protein